MTQATTKPNTASAILKEASDIAAVSPEQHVRKAMAPIADQPVVVLVPNIHTGELTATSSPAFNALEDTRREALVDSMIELLERLRLPVSKR